MDRFDFDAPRWDQSSFAGRLKHFANITDPRVVFASTSELLAAKRLREQYKKGDEPAGTSLEELHRAQKLFGSAFHPDTAELQNLGGRMCFNVYGGTALCGAMMIWYKSTPAVLFWQWANQSFNALVNYTNRNANSELKTSELFVAYSSAVSGALAMAVGLKTWMARRESSQLLQKMVPLGAVAVANAINIPLMRQNELRDGLTVTDKDGNVVGTSRSAAFKAISLVVLSRNAIVAPSMVATPVIMSGLNKVDFFRNNIKLFNIPTQLVLTFVVYGAMVPVGCALFPQQSSISMETIRKYEPEAYEKMKHLNIDTVYFNKGL